MESNEKSGEDGKILTQNKDNNLSRRKQCLEKLIKIIGKEDDYENKERGQYKQQVNK